MFCCCCDALCSLKQVHCTVWRKGDFRDVEGDGGALCPAEALNSLVARLDVSCYISENVLSNCLSCIGLAQYKLLEAIADKVKY